MKGLLLTLETLKNEPNRFLKNICLVNLGQFLYGYRMVDSSMSELIDLIKYGKKNKLSLDPITKYMLNKGNSVQSFNKLILSMECNLKSREMISTPGFMYDEHWIESNRDYLIQRPGLVLGDAMLSHVFHQLNGHIEALKYMDAIRAEEMTLETSNFNNFVCEHFNVPVTCWYDVIRVFVGNEKNGLLYFVKLWDEFKRQP